MLINRLGSVSVIPLITSIMHLIFFTGLLQVTMATADSVYKTASNGGNKQVGNVGLDSLAKLNMARLAKSSAEECLDDISKKPCIDKAEQIAGINFSNEAELINELMPLINNSDSSNSGKLCAGWIEYFKCKAEKACQKCSYFDALDLDVWSYKSLHYFRDKCGFKDLPNPYCPPEDWKKAHNEPYPGECVNKGAKSDCAKKVLPGNGGWNKVLYILLGNTLSGNNCTQVLDMAKCELTAGCNTCNEGEEKSIKDLFQTWLSKNSKCSETKLTFDCSEVTTEGPIPSKSTSKPNPSKPTSKPTSKPKPIKSTKLPKTSSSTSSSMTVIIVVSVLVVLLLIVGGGIIAYCCFCSGKGQKKNAIGKQSGQKMTVKSSASNSKMGGGKSSSSKSGRGKSSSSAGAARSKSQVGAASSKSQVGAAPSKSGVGGSKMGVSKSKV